VVAGLAPPRAEGQQEATGLWPTSFSPHQVAADCGAWSLDRNGFCVADDARNGLEVGVKFRTSRDVRITGVRIYRYDTAKLTASLWTSSGKLLARGSFAAGPASAWQDMSFPEPVTIVPGRTYVASYFTPRTRYAFRYDYFASSGHTVGPITALRSVDGSPNGVYCYDDAACGSFPVRGHRSSTYWVTPLWAGGASVAGSPAAAPRVLRVTPSGDGARVTTRVRITFSKAVRRSTLRSSTVRLMRHRKRVAVRMSYSAAHRRLVLTPRNRLRPGTTYTVVVTDVRDTIGNRVDQDPRTSGPQGGTWTFRTRR
jgi:hypothetical protein